jgi:hypothetical protein
MVEYVSGNMEVDQSTCQTLSQSIYRKWLENKKHQDQTGEKQGLRVTSIPRFKRWKKEYKIIPVYCMWGTCFYFRFYCFKSFNFLKKLVTRVKNSVFVFLATFLNNWCQNLFVYSRYIICIKRRGG